MRKLLLLPIEMVPRSVLNHLKATLPELLPGFMVSIRDKHINLPIEAYNPVRKQYSSTLILMRIIGAGFTDSYDRVLGITTEDLYAQGLNFVFGEASFRGKGAVISLKRLHTSFYGEKEDLELFLERVVKEAVHEIGHTLGLTHCSNPRCVMHFSNSIIDTDLKSEKFCPPCQRKYFSAIRNI